MTTRRGSAGLPDPAPHPIPQRQRRPNFPNPRGIRARSASDGPAPRPRPLSAPERQRRARSANPRAVRARAAARGNALMQDGAARGALRGRSPNPPSATARRRPGRRTPRAPALQPGLGRQPTTPIPSGSEGHSRPSPSGSDGPRTARSLRSGLGYCADHPLSDPGAPATGPPPDPAPCPRPSGSAGPPSKLHRFRRRAKVHRHISYRPILRAPGQIAKAVQFLFNRDTLRFDARRGTSRHTTGATGSSIPACNRGVDAGGSGTSVRPQGVKRPCSNE